MEYGSLLRDDLAFTQHEHRTDELGGSIAYRLAGHRLGGSSVGRGGGLRAATGTAWSFCCLCSIVSVWAGACLWSNCPSCLERSLSMSLLDAGLLICRVCMHRFVVVRREQEFSLSFCFHRGVGKCAKSESGFGRITSAHFYQGRRALIHLKKADERVLGRESDSGRLFCAQIHCKCELFPSH